MLHKPADTQLPGKATPVMACMLVPQTDTGGPEENSKALERPLVKELGKLAL